MDDETVSVGRMTSISPRFIEGVRSLVAQLGPVYPREISLELLEEVIGCSANVLIVAITKEARLLGCYS